STLLSFGSFDEKAPRDHVLEVVSGGEYGLDLEVKGSGLIRVWREQQKERQITLSGVGIGTADRTLIGSSILGGNSSRQTFSRRIRLSQRTKKIKIGIEHVGSSELKILDARLVLLAEAEPTF